MINILNYSCVIADAREKSWQVPLNAIPRGRLEQIENAAIEASLAIIADVFRSASVTHVIVLNRFICKPLMNFNFTNQI